MLVLALVLRLAGAVPMPADAAPGLAAFGDHALCLAAAASDGAPPAGPLGDAPPAPGGHAGHDDGKCCQWHASGGIILPSAGAATPIAFATPVDRSIEAAAPPPGRSIAWARARAPPAAG
jgi:hypothetical protein